MPMQSTITLCNNKNVNGSFSGKLDEKTVWDEFLKGSNLALSALYKLYVRKLYSYGSQFASGVIVLDCIQDLFYDLIRNREKLSPCNSVVAYLYASLRRKIFRTVQKLQKEVAQSKLINDDGFQIDLLQNDADELDMHLAEKIRMIGEMCNLLPLRQREIILLYYFEELSYEEIMEIMNIPKVSSARILVYRALQSLREMARHMPKGLFHGC
jgi:RNA polymerase sigma factor (sigma-70 family)